MGRLELYIPVGKEKLRCGYTTGTCAAAAAAGAARLLLTGERLPAVRVDTPAGVTVEAELLDYAADLVAGGRYIKSSAHDLGKKEA